MNDSLEALLQHLELDEAEYQQILTRPDVVALLTAFFNGAITFTKLVEKMTPIILPILGDAVAITGSVVGGLTGLGALAPIAGLVASLIGHMGLSKVAAVLTPPSPGAA